MPKYELMYIIGSHVADNEIPNVAEEVKKYVTSGKAVIEKSEDLGKKKLAYPINHQKTGNYMVVNFESEPYEIDEIEHKVRTNLAVIRHILLNMDEAVSRMEKDRKEQAKLKMRQPHEEKPLEQPKPKTESGKKIQIDLDAEIEKALESPELK